MADLRLIALVDPRALLEELRSRELNFDPSELPYLRQRPNWNVDHYRVALPSEPPGEPCTEGSWSIARELSSAYEFVDPYTLRAFHDPGERFEGRSMLLEIHSWGLRIYVGVRVGGEYDGYRVEGGRRARVWAWNYQTLAGHFEKGQIEYEVRKWLDSGEVEFRIDVVSHRTDAGNVLVDLGFLLFGRSKQTRFARDACERMAWITRAVLEGNLDLSLLHSAKGLAIRPGSIAAAEPKRAGRTIRRRASDAPGPRHRT